MSGPFRKQRVSASALGTFVTCPEKYRRGYLLDQWGPGSPATYIGSVVHTSIEEALKQKARRGLAPEGRELVEIVDLAHARHQAEDDVEWGDDMTPGSARARAGNAVAAYVEQVLPALHLTGKPEQWFELAVAGSPVPVVGKLDLPVRVNTALLRDPEGGMRAYGDLLGEYEDVIVDLKTGRQAAKAVAPQWRIQGLIYAAVARKPIDYHTLTPYGEKGPVVRTPHTPTITRPKATKANPEPETSVAYECGELRVELDGERHAGTLALVRRLVGGIQAYYDRFGADEPWPSGAIAHMWACNWCDHKPDCVYWHGEQPADPFGLA